MEPSTTQEFPMQIDTTQVFVPNFYTHEQLEQLLGRKIKKSQWKVLLSGEGFAKYLAQAIDDAMVDALEDLPQ